MIEGPDFSAASTIGARKEQQDEWGTHVNPPSREEQVRLLAVVADGMGGMPAGDTASRLALSAFLDSYVAIDRPSRERLRHALAHANREVGIAVEAEPELDGMGCTLVAALFFADRCYWLSVGDSLLLRYRHGEIRRINPLHIYANDLDEQVRRGELSEEQAANHPDRVALTSAIQGTVLDEVSQGEFVLEPDDVLLLATDGIETLSEKELISICASRANGGAAGIAHMVIESINALAREHQDNATIIVVRQPSPENGPAEADTKLLGAKSESMDGNDEDLQADRPGMPPTKVATSPAGNRLPPDPDAGSV